MINLKKLLQIAVLSMAALTIAACSTSKMQVAQESKPGFSNISDIPLPKSAKIDMNKSMVMGGGDSWTGHLAYTTNKSPADVVDFVIGNMKHAGWLKVSEQRGNDTVINFIRKKRVATVRINLDKGYISDQTLVSVDMTNSTVTHALVNSDDESIKS